MLANMGDVASSKSAMKTVAPEFSALTIILRSTGPVISTRRSSRSLGDRRDLPVAVANRISSPGENRATCPASNSFWRSARRASSSNRRRLKRRCRSARNASASALRISACRPPGSARISIPAAAESSVMRSLRKGVRNLSRKLVDRFAAFGEGRSPCALSLMRLYRPRHTGRPRKQRASRAAEWESTPSGRT